MDTLRRRIDCPLPKRRILRRDTGELREAAAVGVAVEQRAAERLTGRLANLSHVLPELPPTTASRWRRRRPSRRRSRPAR